MLLVELSDLVLDETARVEVTTADVAGTDTVAVPSSTVM